MAKVKVRDLGTVTKVHESGLVETSKKLRVNIKAEKGDKLVMDENRKVSIVQPKKAPVQKVPATKPDVTEDDLVPTVEDNTDGE